MADFFTGRRRALNEASDQHVRTAQEIMDGTVQRLHAELEDMRVSHARRIGELETEFTDMARTLQDCERDRIRLRIRVEELENRLNPEGG